MTAGVRRFLRRLGSRGADVTERQIMKERELESFPYVVEYGVPSDYAFPARFSCSAFRGLRYCEVLARSSAAMPADGPTVKVVTFWRDRESFDRQAPAFGAALGGLAPLWQGYQGQVEARARPRWWKNAAAVYLAAVHTVAVVGTVEALRTHYAELFAPGNVHLYSREGEYDLLEGQPFRMAYKVRNIGSATTALSLKAPQIVRVTEPASQQSSGAPPDCARARTAAPTARPADVGVTLGDDVREVPDITVGEIEEVTLSGVAQHAGRYCVAVDGTARSGMVRRVVGGDAAFRTDLAVRVWPRIGIDVRTARVDPNRCSYLVTLSSGVAFADGIGVSAEVRGVADAAFRFVHGIAVADARVPRTVATRGAEVSGIDWLTHPLPAMKDTTLTLDLQKTGATPDVCSEIARRITIREFAAKEFTR